MDKHVQARRAESRVPCLGRALGMHKGNGGEVLGMGKLGGMLAGGSTPVNITHIINITTGGSGPPAVPPFLS